MERRLREHCDRACGGRRSAGASVSKTDSHARYFSAAIHWRFADGRTGQEGQIGSPGSELGRRLGGGTYCRDYPQFRYSAFRYAVKKQADYENARWQPGPNRDDRPALGHPCGLAGGGDQGEVLLNAMMKIPGLRFRRSATSDGVHQRKLVNRLKKFNFDVNGYEDYRKCWPRRRIWTRWSSQRRTSGTRSTPSIVCGREARVLREGDVQHPRRARNMVLQPGKRQTSSDRHQRGAIRVTCIATKSYCRRRNCWPDRHGAGAVESFREAGQRLAAALSDSRGAAEEIRLQVDAAVPQLALVQGLGAADRGSRIAPDRHLQLVPRTGPSHVRRAAAPITMIRRPRMVRHVMAIYEYQTAAGKARRITKRRRPTAAGLFRNLHG